MAVTLVTSPQRNIIGYISDVASTTQLLYEFNESVITPGETYVFQIEVKFVTPPAIPTISDLILFYLPQSNGDIKFNIGPSVKFVLLKSGITNTSYTIDYTSIRDGVETPEGTTTPILAVLSRRQILTEHGANLYELIAKFNNSGSILTDFEFPRFWDGWTKNVYWINQDLDVDYDITETVQDINGSDLASTPDTKTITEFVIEEWELTYPAVTNQYQVRLLIESSVQVVFYKYYTLYPECENPVMLSWVNSLGGIDQWLFQTEQAIVNRSEQGRLFQQPIIEDIENVRNTKGRNAPIDTQFMTLKVDQINQNELQALHDIMRSELVHLWLNKTGTEYVNVRVSAGYETTFTTGKTLYEFSINIELPDNFDFFKAKLY